MCFLRTLEWCFLFLSLVLYACNSQRFSLHVDLANRTGKHRDIIEIPCWISKKLGLHLCLFRVVGHHKFMLHCRIILSPPGCDSCHNGCVFQSQKTEGLKIK